MIKIKNQGDRVGAQEGNLSFHCRAGDCLKEWTSAKPKHRIRHHHEHDGSRPQPRG